MDDSYGFAGLLLRVRGLKICSYFSSLASSLASNSKFRLYFFAIDFLSACVLLTSSFCWSCRLSSSTYLMLACRLCSFACSSLNTTRFETFPLEIKLALSLSW